MPAELDLEVIGRGFSQLETLSGENDRIIMLVIIRRLVGICHLAALISSRRIWRRVS